MSMSLCVSAYMYLPRPEKGCDCLEWEFQADVSSMMWVLEKDLHGPKTEPLEHLSSLCDHF